MIAAESPETSFAPINAVTGEELRLALQDLRLAGRILPVGARLVVRHIFKSEEKEPLEAIYAFRLPRDASLRRFCVTGEGFSVRSELKPVEEATDAYEKGIAAGHLSTMARAYRDGMINLNVGNIAPGETVTVWLEIVAGVESHDDGFRFRFPFTLAPTYHRAARAVAVGQDVGQMELPEEEFGDAFLPPWHVDPSLLHDVGFSLRVIAAEAIHVVSSPSHPISVQNCASSKEAHVALATDKDVPNRDLVLDVKTKGNYCGVLWGRDRRSRVRFAGVIPSDRFGTTEIGARKVVFVLDRSGSMEGPPIAQARKAVEACLATLSANDQFGIVAFDSEVELFQPSLALGTSDNRESARKFLAGIHACGGTELLAGIQAGQKLLANQGGDLLILTDGQVAGTESITQAVKGTNSHVHCLGIGSASQDRFLTLLARETNGVCRFLSPRERVDVAALELFAAAGRPVAQNVQYEVSGLSDANLMPAPPSVVFKGTPVVIFGSAPQADGAILMLRWEKDGEVRQIGMPFGTSDDGVGETLRLIHGARLITDLENQITDASPETALARRRESRLWKVLENLSREYGLASRAMSLVAVVERPSDQVGKVPTTRIVPVGLPEDMPFEAYFESKMEDSLSYHLDFGLQALSFSAGPIARLSMMSILYRDDDRDDQRDDQLIELAGRLEPDGGMPGENPEERLLASLLALIVFNDANNTSRPGTFTLHIQRLRAYIQIADLSALDASKANTVRAVLDIIARNLPIPPELSALALSTLARKHLRLESAWRNLKKQLRDMG